MKTLTANEYSKTAENSLPFYRRFYIYQKERFPVLGHGVLVASFSFSAIAYSRICRGAEGFVSWSTFLVGIFTTITLFLLVRIFDEFKDAEDDARYRKNLPVPRGLISLRELLVIGMVVAVLQVSVIMWFMPKMLLIYLVVIGYLSLMGKEFFVAEWLKKHQFWYVASHMFIIPLVDIYASGLDWLLEGVAAPKGLLFFFAVSYMNGVVQEVGRKIRAPEKEAEGVLTYSAMLGAARAVWLWIGILFVTLCLSIAAAHYAGFGQMAFFILGSIFLLCSLPAVLFLSTKTEKTSKSIELASAVWTISMYLSLGGIPMLQQLLFR
ncbi:UbiA family prenyltransferase [Botryobacter ruber]|uniref:UbiA family prenyltransferase n=1 Tax=Botryobacter ruber TaxID=2171629 RepID=UPI000E0C254D|nr:UbiA family prenyltransferase [Botryobacter ruber]